MSGAQCYSPHWNLWTPNLTHRAITLTWTLTVKTQDDHYYRLCYLSLFKKMSLCFLPDLITRTHFFASPPKNDYSQPHWWEEVEKCKVQWYHFPQRNNVLPSVTQKEKHIKKRNASLNFCLCTADIKDPQKEGWTSELYLSWRDREENTPSFLAVLRATL